MRARLASLIEIEPRDLRAALLNPAGLTLLIVSALAYLAVLAASRTIVPGLVPLAGTMAWLVPLGVLAYLATVVACLRTKVYPDGLTEREVEVLRLIAEGKTSREIAGQLIVTIATVSRHIANIYTKIDAHGRADATRYAYEHELVRAGGESRADREGKAAGGLSAFEADVLRLKLAGKTNKQIARQLGVSEAAVAKAIEAITTKIAARKVPR